MTLAVKDGEAVELAAALGIDCRAEILKTLETDFDEKAHLCRYLMGDSEYRARVIDIFRERLPLEEMKQQPSDELCLGEKFKNELDLVFLVQELGKYPCEGTDLVEASLQCAPPQNRNMALRVLKTWTENKPLRELLPETHKLLGELRKTEPNSSACEMMDELL